MTRLAPQRRVYLKAAEGSVCRQRHHREDPGHEGGRDTGVPDGHTVDEHLAGLPGGFTSGCDRAEPRTSEDRFPREE